MKISIIHFGDEEKLVSSMFLSLFFHVSYLKAWEVNPLSVAGSSVIILDTDGYVEDDVFELQARWLSIEPYPVAVFSERPGVENSNLYKALKISNRLFKSDGLSNIVAEISSLGSPPQEQASLLGLMSTKGY